MSATDFVDLALRVSRDDFREAWRNCFLVGAMPRAPQHRSHKTATFSTNEGERTAAGLRGVPSHTALAAFPIRKVHQNFSQMMTVGRTSNNDIVIVDLQVSKFHAFFRESPEGLWLADAGSKNGTFVDGAALPPKGKPVLVPLKSQIGFGKLIFTVLDAGQCWDRLRREAVMGR